MYIYAVFYSFTSYTYIYTHILPLISGVQLSHAPGPRQSLHLQGLVSAVRDPKPTGRGQRALVVGDISVVLRESKCYDRYVMIYLSLNLKCHEICLRLFELNHLDNDRLIDLSAI